VTDTKRPFAQAERDAVVMAGIQLLAPDTDYELVKSYASEINAAVERERREAAVKALRYAADMIEPSEIKAGPGGAPGFVQGKEDGLTIAAKYLRARAERIERGEQ
jgi:hypothetical protein